VFQLHMLGREYPYISSLGYSQDLSSVQYWCYTLHFCQANLNLINTVQLLPALHEAHIEFHVNFQKQVIVRTISAWKNSTTFIAKFSVWQIFN
jgi:hypothetical protein